MSTAVPDYAFNHKLGAYNVGRPARTKKLVVRVGQVTSSKMTAGTHDIVKQDTTDAGKCWSPEELHTKEVFSSKLAVVVGEFLPTISPTDPAPADSTKGNPMFIKDFNPEIHEVVPTMPGARMVVAVPDKSGSRVSFYVPYDKDKETGLCALLQITEKTTGDRLFIYPEFTVDAQNKQKKGRLSLWKSVISAFHKEYIASHLHELLDIPTTSKSERKQLQFDEGKQAIAKVCMALAMYKEVGDDRYLKQARSIANSALGRPEETMPRSDADKIIDNLICGHEGFTNDEAFEAASVCNVSLSFHDSCSQVFTLRVTTLDDPRCRPI